MSWRRRWFRFQVRMGWKKIPTIWELWNVPEPVVGTNLKVRVPEKFSIRVGKEDQD